MADHAFLIIVVVSIAERSGIVPAIPAIVVAIVAPVVVATAAPIAVPTITIARLWITVIAPIVVSAVIVAAGGHRGYERCKWYRSDNRFGLFLTHEIPL
jgi:hypothetical protein